MKKFPIIALFLLMLSFVACDKDKAFISVYYLETSCADQWTRAQNDSETIENLKDYLANQNIKTKDISINRINGGEACLACSCKTGKEISLKVHEKDLSKIKDLDFFEK